MMTLHQTSELNRPMLKRASTVAMIAMVVLVSACSSSKRAQHPRYSATGPHQIVVTQSERKLPVHFGQDESTLAPHVLAPVQVFADDFVDQGGGTLFIDVAEGQDDGTLAGKLSYLGVELRKRGVQESELVVRSAGASDGASDSAGISLAYVKYSASVPGCPDWSQTMAGFHRNVTHSNFGCSVRSNLAKMLANPRDLIEPRTFTHADATQASRAISTLRSGEAEPVTSSASEIGSKDE